MTTMVITTETFRRTYRFPYIRIPDEFFKRRGDAGLSLLGFIFTGWFVPIRVV
jgi:hypothetical protein